MKRLMLFFFLVVLLVTGCDIFERRFSEGRFPENVENLGDINSIDDDYNSTSHVVGNVEHLIFSSKRGGRTDFNLVNEAIDIRFNLKGGKFLLENHRNYYTSGGSGEQTPFVWATNVANSLANELGPYVRSYNYDLLANDSFYGNAHYGEYLMFFASDRTGNLDIYLTHNYQDSTNATSGTPLSSKNFTLPVPIPCLNSLADDGYPTFDQTNTSIYFTSNREGKFAIYKAALPVLSPTELHKRLPELTNVSIAKVPELASSADDKCPFISGNTLVFTSNRPGGYGGYDLYYTKWDGTHWLEPVNFGKDINTASDEYRPILVNIQQFGNQLMIFSSNRLGGKGGFDLYRVGIEK